MDLSFGSPPGALIALAHILPLGAFLAFERRAQRMRASLRLPPASARAQRPAVAALVGIGVLLALAAAQPVLARATPRAVRGDVEVYAVFDVSLSMAASQRGGRTRLARAKELAVQLRGSLPELPMGVASFTQRTVPHLFPSADPAVFTGVVNESVQIWEPRPPASFRPGSTATDLESIAELAGNGYFAPGAKHRIAVVFTDGESLPAFPELIADAFRRRHKVKVILVHVWDAAERIQLGAGTTDPNYVPNPSGIQLLREIAAEASGAVFDESDAGGVLRRLGEDAGQGPTREAGIQRSRTPLAPWLVLAAAVPLGVVLRRRNL